MISLTTLDVKNIRIMKLSVLAHSDVTAVELTGDTLGLSTDLKCFEGQKLFWEENTTPLDSSPAVEAFQNTANRMSLNVKDGRGSDSTLTKLAVDKRWNVSRLRAHIREAFNLEEHEVFRICKFNNPQSEINGDENKSIFALGFYSGMTIVLKSGAPLPPGHFHVKVFLYHATYRAGVYRLGDVLPKHVVSAEVDDPIGIAAVMTAHDQMKELSEDIVDDVVPVPVAAVKKCTFGSDKVALVPTTQQFEFLMDLPIHEDMLVDDLRALLFEQLKSRNFMSESDSVKQVRVRLKGGQTCTDILRDSFTLRQSKVVLYADRPLAVQVGGKERWGEESGREGTRYDYMVL